MSGSSTHSTDGGVALPDAAIPAAAASAPAAPPATTRSRKPRPTHFLSLPLTSPSVGPSLATLAASIPHVPAGAWRPANTLHLTLGVLTLTPATLAAATRLLSTVDVSALPLPISLAGLATLSSPRRATVLYAVPRDTTGQLQEFAECVRRVFEDAGLVVHEDRPLRLHATVANTVYCRGRGRAQALDLRGVLDEFAGWVLAEAVVIDRVALCKMGAGPAGYEVVAFKSHDADEVGKVDALTADAITASMAKVSVDDN